MKNQICIDDTPTPSDILSERALVKFIGSKLMDAWDWVYLLKKYPQYHDKCDFKFTDHQIMQLILSQPRFTNQLIGKLKSDDGLIALFCNRPELLDWVNALEAFDEYLMDILAYEGILRLSGGDNNRLKRYYNEYYAGTI